MSLVTTKMETPDDLGLDSGAHRPRCVEQLVVTPPEGCVVELVRLFKLLADDTRLRILSYLQQVDELNVRELCELLSQRQPSVSHHLAMLKTAGLVEMRRDGKHNFYRMIPAKLEQLITHYFAGSPGQPARICFDADDLRYAQVTASSSTVA